MKAGLIDYDMGNLKSVGKALETAGCSVKLVTGPSGLKSLDLLVLPGVGSFHVAARNLKDRRLFEPVKDWISNERPFLGICLGYQLLFEEGEEGSARIRGLSLFRGNVRKFPRKKNLKVPHMGWNQILWKSPGNGIHPIPSGIPNGSYFYFVHSFFPVPESREIVATTTRYGVDFASSVSRRNLFACQFHPEKSGRNGIRLLKNFMRSIE